MKPRSGLNSKEREELLKRVCALSERHVWACKILLWALKWVGKALPSCGAALSDSAASQALFDPATGLPGRELFFDRLRQAIRRSRRMEAACYAVLCLNLDRFKFVSDSLGADLADRILAAVARRIEPCLRETDSLARLNGDEFSVLLEGLRLENDAVQIVQRVQAEIARPIELEGHEVYTTTSIGIAPSTPEYEKPEDVLRDAGTAMHKAKEMGGAQMVVFSPGMRRAAVDRFRLEADLREAIQRERFCLHYQPIVSLESGEVSGFEALIRWPHPERGMVSPMAFIPIAEETGLIQPIGRWVLREACRQMREWKDTFRFDRPVRMSVNLSGRQLSDPDLLEQIDTALQDAGLEPDALKIEITESMLMTATSDPKGVLSRIKDLRIRLLIDDFGTGYSSLSYLQEFPFDTLKIDRSFVRKMATWRDRPGILSAIVTLAHDMGLDVIAEGVETKEQVALVQSLGCEWGQGYYFHKPMDREAVATLLSSAQTI